MYNFISKLKLFFLTIFLFAGVSLVSAGWDVPITGPTGNNTPPPINVGVGYQEKEGGLHIQSILGVFGKFVFPRGAGENKVLISDANGTASWGDISSIPTDGGDDDTGPTSTYTKECNPNGGNCQVNCGLDKVFGIEIVGYASEWRLGTCYGRYGYISSTSACRLTCGGSSSGSTRTR